MRGGLDGTMGRTYRITCTAPSVWADHSSILGLKTGRQGFMASNGSSYMVVFTVLAWFSVYFLMTSLIQGIGIEDGLVWLSVY